MSNSPSWTAGDRGVRFEPEVLELFMPPSSTMPQTAGPDDLRNSRSRRRLQGTLGLRVIRELQQVADQGESRRWETPRYRLEYRPAQVALWTEDGRGGVGTAVSAAAFLSGSFQREVAEIFGTAILDAIRSLCRGETLTRLPSVLPEGQGFSIPTGEPIALETWEWGSNWEYNYSARVFEGVILWRLVMDEQYGGHEYRVLQEVGPFLTSGPPDNHGFASTIPESSLTRIRSLLT